MALGHSPKIVTNGLIFAYDMGPNPGDNKSWKGKPTTNLVTAIQNYSNEGTYWDRIDDSIFHFYLKTSYNSWCVRAYAGSYTTGKTYTFSFQYKGESPSSGDLTIDNDGADNNIWNDTLTTSTQWQTYTSTITSTATAAWYMYFRRNGGGNIYIKNVQLEENSFATPFVNGTRSNTQALLDWTGNHTITANSLTYNSDGTFSFNGTSNYMTVGSSSDWAFGGNGTIEQWVYPTNSTGNDRLWCVNNNSSSIDAYLNSTGYTLYYHGNTANGGTLTQNSWNHVCVTYTNGTIQTYINGVAATMSGTTTGYNITNSAQLIIGEYQNLGGYKIYGKIPVMKVYNRSLTAAEVAQNFNAHRARYGI